MATGGTKPVGEFEVIYVPSKGLDYSRPYNTLDKEFLAPDSVNTQSINGFLCSSPWVGGSPYNATMAPGEIVLGQFLINNTDAVAGQSMAVSVVLYVTNIAVYIEDWSTVLLANPTAQPLLQLVHAWAPGEVNTQYMSAGNTVAFVEVQTGPIAPHPTAIVSVYFTGQMFNGVFRVTSAGIFATATTYVCGRYIGELGGRLVVAQARFPTGGGPFGDLISSTVAWSGVGSFDGVGATDPWDPANFAALNGNVGGFNLLTDTPDQLTGIATFGRSGTLARTHGFTTMDPGPSGIDPYLFYHLWSSPEGVGAYNETFQQYGPLSAFRADDNIYLMSLDGGLVPIGNPIISKINADARAAGFRGDWGGNWVNGPGTSTIWYLASFAIIAGQLHYLLSFNAFTGDLPVINPTNATCIVYDYNVVEQSWNVWDMGQYYQEDGTQSPGFLYFSSPILDARVVLTKQANIGLQLGLITIDLKFLLFGGITLGQSGVTPADSQIFQLVPLDYDTNTNPFTDYWAPVYPPLAMPATLIKFRGEQVQLGHTINMRRLRMQSQNAPFPTSVANYQGQVIVRFEGPINGQAFSNAINLDVPVLMQTDYGDVVLGDEMIQAAIIAVVTGGTPWLNLPLLRLSTVSIIGSDTKGSTA